MHKDIVDFLNSNVADSKANLVESEVGDSAIFVEASSILEVCRALKTSSDFNFNVLQVITGCDYKDRIELSYILASYSKNLELILKTKLDKPTSDAVPEIESVVSVWKAANYQEREAYDMVGVKFNNHPDHRRILCPYDWEGFPLRRDYVVQEVYNGMTVNPEEKLNNPDFDFYKNLQAKVGKDQKITHSWEGSKSLTFNKDVEVHSSEDNSDSNGAGA